MRARWVAVASGFMSVMGGLYGCGGQEFASAPAGRDVDREEAKGSDAARSPGTDPSARAVVATPGPQPAALPRPGNVLLLPPPPAAPAAPVLAEQGEDGVRRPVPSQPAALAAKSTGFENGPSE